MIHLPASVRVYVCLTACDMRKSFDSLHALVRDHLELDAFAGHLFVFASRRRDRLKILYWDRDGFAIWSKRLEEGTYAVPLEDGGEERRREITPQELGAILSGIDLTQAARRERYRKSDKKQNCVILFLAKSKSLSKLITYSWPSILNTFRTIPKFSSEWYWT